MLLLYLLLMAASAMGQSKNPCRYYATAPPSVSYYTCSEMALKYHISLEMFFALNPKMDPDCTSILAEGEYCVSGDFSTTSTDGKCGPDYPYVTCRGYQRKQCCNSQTWTCGGTREDCEPGICWEGGCSDALPQRFSFDGKCGPKHNDKVCSGPWGNCCNWAGDCGTGPGYCDSANCESGLCDFLPGGINNLPDNTGYSFTPDGKCGNLAGNYTCGEIWGPCCGPGNICGGGPQFCGAGCQPDYGTCDPVPTPQPGDPSPDGTCAGPNGFVCTDAPFGPCCGSAGYCGTSPDYCGAGCQSEFGTCSNSTTATSPDGTCGPESEGGWECLGSAFGSCCSHAGYCGDGAVYCGPGCQSGYGACDDAASNVSPDGTCGSGSSGLWSCDGSGFGGCCSGSGYCGDGAAYCGGGCQEGYGSCSGGVSTDGSCGAQSGKTCAGAGFGGCCSRYGWCGDSDSHCGAGCQSGFGECHISTDGVCGSNGMTCVGSGFGDCCSRNDNCGDTVNYCAQGCQTAFSNGCMTSNDPTLDGTCGSSAGGYTCAGGPYDGQCCSAFGYCGTTSGHCGSGCQSNYGSCS